MDSQLQEIKLILWCWTPGNLSVIFAVIGVDETDIVSESSHWNFYAQCKGTVGLT